MTAALYPARYSDGRTAAMRLVRAALDDSRLSVVDESGGLLDAWPLAEIRAVGLADSDGTLRLSRAGGDARLTVTNADFSAQLRSLCPDLHRPVSPPHVRWRRIALWTGGTVASLAVFFFVIVPIFAREVVRLTPPAVEARAGAWMSDHVINLMADTEAKRQGKAVCQRPDGQAVLERLVFTLTTHATLPAPAVVQVVNSPIINAFALPGGRVLIFRGLLEAAVHPNEVAGVLAHELGHAELRHPLQIAIEQSSGAFVIGLLFGDAVGFSIMGMTVSALLRGYYSRSMETEADDRGLALMRAADFAVEPLAHFFTRLAQREKTLPGLFSVLSTHPDSGDRAARIRAMPREGSRAMSNGDWQALSGICR